MKILNVNTFEAFDELYKQYKQKSGTIDLKNLIFLFIASIDKTTGQSWCSDCRNADPVLDAIVEKFKFNEQLVLAKVEVGQSEGWKKVDNPFRTHELQIVAVPTLLSLKTMDNKLEFSTQAYSKMVMHAMKYPHSTCGGFLLSIVQDEKEGDKGTLTIVEAIPVSHASHGLSPNIEIAFNSVSLYAEEEDMIISGYYQSDDSRDSNSLDIFAQRIVERICETFPGAVLCNVGFEGPEAKTILDCHQYIDGKWRRRSSQTFQVENDPDVISESILYSKEKLYRKVVDFDDYFNDIALDWTNAKISERIDHLVASIG